jgi:hypothetical protein
MSFCGPENISVVRAGIESEVTPSGIRKVDFATVLNRIVIHTCTPPRRLTFSSFVTYKSSSNFHGWLSNGPKKFNIVVFSYIRLHTIVIITQDFFLLSHSLNVEKYPR